MATIGNTEADVLIPELWRAITLDARYDAMVMGPRVLNLDAEVQGKGDRIHIPIKPVVAVNDVGAAGAITPQALTATEAVLVIDQHKESSIEVEDKAEIQSLINLLADFSSQFGEAIAEDTDGALTALHADVSTNTVGSATAAADEDLVTAAVQKLLAQKLAAQIRNPNDVTFIFHTAKWPELKKVDAFNDANITGKAEGGAMMMSVPNLYGIPVYFTNQIKETVSTKRNLLFHREAFSWAMQKNLTIELLAKVKLTRPLVGSVLYGVKTVREEHAVRVDTSPTA